MQGQRGWRELAVLGDKINKFSGMIEGFIWSPRSGDNTNKPDAWAFEEVNLPYLLFFGLTSSITKQKYCLIDLRFVLSLTKQGPHSDFPGPNSGSTACVAVIRNKQLFVANAGDSRCVISRKGQVKHRFVRHF